MSILLFLILASLSLALTALIGFVWAVKSGQFEDTCTPSMRVLMEEGAGGPKSIDCSDLQTTQSDHSHRREDVELSRPYPPPHAGGYEQI